MGVDEGLSAFLGGVDAFKDLLAVDPAGRHAVNGDAFPGKVARQAFGPGVGGGRRAWARTRSKGFNDFR